MAHRISVGYYFDDTRNGGTMVGITLGNNTMGLTPDLARDIAVDLMLWADRIDPPSTRSQSPGRVENQEVTE